MIKFWPPCLVVGQQVPLPYWAILYWWPLGEPALKPPSGYAKKNPQMWWGLDFFYMKIRKKHTLYDGNLLLHLKKKLSLLAISLHSYLSLYSYVTLLSLSLILQPLDKYESQFQGHTALPEEIIRTEPYWLHSFSEARNVTRIGQWATLSHARSSKWSGFPDTQIFFLWILYIGCFQWQYFQNGLLFFYSNNLYHNV